MSYPVQLRVSSWGNREGNDKLSKKSLPLRYIIPQNIFKVINIRRGMYFNWKN